MIRFVTTVYVLAVFAVGLCATARGQSEPESPPELRKQQLSLDDSLASIVIDEAWHLELLAAEPDIVDPVDATMDAEGNVWVVEMRDYPYLKEGEKPTGTVKVLKPRPGGGWNAIEFATGLDMPTGIGLWKNGAVLTVSGAVIYLEDRNGDFVADHQQILLKGLSQGNEQLRANHPTLRPDGWWYVASGLRGGRLEPGTDWGGPQGAGANSRTGPIRTAPLDIGARDFRFRLDTYDYQPVTGPSQFGLAFDCLGNRYGVSNRNPALQVMLEETELAGNPLAGWFRSQQDVLPAGAESRVWPLIGTWTTSNLHAGQYTAACGITVVPLPSSTSGACWAQQLFVCEPTASLVSRNVLMRPGMNRFSWELNDPEPGRPQQWLASTDPWFRPVNIRHAPNGGLLVVDMHRAVIEHPHWVPEELKQRPDETFGKQAGRIYLVRPSSELSEPVVQYDSLESHEVARRLTTNSTWQRQVATRILLERNSTDPTTLASIFAASQSDHGSTHFDTATLYMTLHPVPDQAVSDLLNGGGCSSQVIIAVLRSDTIGQLSEQCLLPLFSTALKPESGALRLEAALALGRLGENKRASILAQNPIAFDVAAVDSLANDAALMCYSSALRDQRAKWLAALLDAAAEHPEVVTQLDTEGLNSLAGAVSRLAVKDRNSSLDSAPWIHIAMRLAKARLPRLRLLGYRVLTRVRLQEKVYARIRDAALGDASDADNPESVRVAAIELLSTMPLAGSSAALSSLMVDHSASVALAALQCLASSKSAEGSELVAQQIQSKHPSVRSAVVDSACKSHEIRSSLLAKLGTGSARPEEIGLDALRRIRDSASGEDRTVLSGFLATIENSDRARLVVNWQDCLSLSSDVAIGKSLFKQHCAGCHRIGQTGINIGPDISDSRNTSKASLLTAILDPNRAVDNNYFRRSILTSDGQVIGGIVTGETAQTLTIVTEQAKRVVVLKSDIEYDRTLRRSLMPEGFETQLSKQQLANIIGYIKNWRYIASNVPAQSDP